MKNVVVCCYFFLRCFVFEALSGLRFQAALHVTVQRIHNAKLLILPRKTHPPLLIIFFLQGHHVYSSKIFVEARCEL